MESLDAQCLIVDLAEDEGLRPDHWQHRRDGSLACWFGEGPRTFSWPPQAVAAMAGRWRRRRRPVPTAIAGLVASHSAFVELLVNAKLEQPRSIIHDLQTGEVTACWDDERALVVIGPE